MELPPQVRTLVQQLDEQGKVCPMPIPWDSIWKMLPERSRPGGTWSPPPPLILAAWHHTSAAAKRKRFVAHLLWAYDHDALPVLRQKLAELGDRDWLRGNQVQTVD